MGKRFPPHFFENLCCSPLSALENPELGPMSVSEAEQDALIVQKGLHFIPFFPIGNFAYYLKNFIMLSSARVRSSFSQSETSAGDRFFIPFSIPS